MINYSRDLSDIGSTCSKYCISSAKYLLKDKWMAALRIANNFHGEVGFFFFFFFFFCFFVWFGFCFHSS
jgi:hypothetical protein